MCSCLGISYNAINTFGDEEASHSEKDKSGGDAPEPGQRWMVLAGDNHVHAPHTGDNIHGQDDSAQHGQLVEYIVGLLGLFRHFDVDLRKIIGVCTG